MNPLTLQMFLGTSDVANLKRCDIQENRIEIVTEKTNVVLSIGTKPTVKLQRWTKTHPSDTHSTEQIDLQGNSHQDNSGCP
jgi:hypothetical protein